MTPSRIILDPDTLPAEGRSWTLALGGLLAGLLAFMPAAFGAVEAWSELAVITISAVLSIGLALWFAFGRNIRPVATWAWLPLLLFAMLVVFQIVPWPTGVVRWLSPSTVSTRQELLGEDSAPNGQATISFYPLATAHGLRMLLVGMTCFAVGACAFRNSRQIKALLTAVFAVGCVEALLALVQLATGAGKIYWSIPTPSGAPSGSFINYSHFSQFMNLSLGAGIALVLIRLHEDRRADIRARAGRFWPAIDWEAYGWLIVGIIFSAVAVLTSMSRNGAISLVVAAAVIGSLLFRRGSLSWWGWLVGMLPLGVFAGLLLFGFDSVYARLSTLSHADSYESRWELTLGTLRAWRAFPIWGTGLGTHEYVFSMFDSSTSPYLAAHADNDYAELLEELGIAGAICVAAFLASIGFHAIRLMSRGRSPLSSAAYGISFGLLAVAIHSATDFGQRVPAVFCLSALFCGLLIAIANIEQRSTAAQKSTTAISPFGSVSLRRAAALASVIGLLTIWGWAWKDAYAAYLGERWWAASLELEAQLQQQNHPASDQDYIDLIASADAARQSEPQNVKYGYWLNEYRWRSLSRVIDPTTGQLVLHPDVLPFIARIADDLSQVRQICPTYGPPYALEGELRLFVLNDRRGGELIRQAVRLASYDPSTCLVAGELAARTGQAEQAESLLNRADKLSPANFREVIGVYLFDLHRPDLAKSLAGDDFERLSTLAAVCADSKDYNDLARDISAAAEDSLRRRAATTDVQPRELALLASEDFRRGDFAAAAELYRRALNLDYRQIDWHLQRARALKEAGQSDEALHEVRICLRLRPEDPAATKLLEELTSRAKSH
jgi:tetratricopeptide (TPR) repeat protein/O-antigen ligase